MRTVLHLSDLHFGRVDEEVVAGLRRSAHDLAPDVVAVSGDLTQRAKRREFAAATAFLRSLPGAKVVVPGNHDVPLYNVLARFARPLVRFHDHVDEQFTRPFVDDEIAVVGVNTARSLVFKGGRINLAQMQAVREVFCATDSRRVRIVVTHHPFHLSAPREDDDLVGRAALAMQQWRDCMPDVLLAGHMHAHDVGTTAERYDLDGRSAITVQAGTATSTRARGERNSFNVLHVDRDSIAVCKYHWSMEQRAFAPDAGRTYRRHGEAWLRDDPS